MDLVVFDESVLSAEPVFAEPMEMETGELEVETGQLEMETGGA